MIWIQVRDVHAEHARLAAAGVPVVRAPAEERWGLTEMHIEDPDGVRIILVEVPADHPLRRDPRPALPTASQSIRFLRRGRLTLVDDEDRLGMRAGVDVRIPHRHDVEQALVFHNCHVPPGSRCLAVGMLPGALLIIELSDLHYASFAPLLRAPRISRRSR